MNWNVVSNVVPETAEKLVGLILDQRGIGDVDSFLHPASPLDLTPKAVGISEKPLAKAIKLIKKIGAAGGDICIVGDYDADGICATAIAWSVMHGMGYKVRPFIPSREKHGYGLNSKVLADVLADGKPDLIITVDNGIVAHAPVAEAKALGIKVIVTDHHQPENSLPEADAIVHTTKLCGATVSWMLMQALASELVAEQLDLAGIATIADQVPLVGANRQFAVHGVAALRTAKRVGLQALFQQMGSNQAEADTHTVGYGIAPRINAMGRLAHGMDALRLLCTRNARRAAELAQVLGDTNTSRQALTEELLEHARQQVASQVEQRILVVHSSEYHEGVLGLLAGKLTEEFGKPTVAIKVGQVMSKGSARSILGVNVVELLRLVREDLLEVGGHPMAAGFGLESVRMQVFTQKLQRVALESITVAQLEPRLDIVCELPHSLLTLETAAAIETLQPFGQGNPEPVFVIKNLRLIHSKVIGKDGRHLKLQFGTDDPLHPSIEAVWWGGAEGFAGNLGNRLSVATRVSVDRWKVQAPKLSLVVSDYKDIEEKVR